jgi:hypothetical protein
MFYVSVNKSLRDAVLDPILAIEYDYGLKNRSIGVTPSRFREIASGNLQLPGGSTHTAISCPHIMPLRRVLRHEGEIIYARKEYCIFNAPSSPHVALSHESMPIITVGASQQ